MSNTRDLIILCGGVVIGLCIGYAWGAAHWWRPRVGDK